MRVRRLCTALAALAMVLVPVGMAAGPVVATSGSVSVADNGVISSRN